MNAIRGLCMERLVYQNFYYFNENSSLNNLNNVFVNELSRF